MTSLSPPGDGRRGGRAADTSQPGTTKRDDERPDVFRNNATDADERGFSWQEPQRRAAELLELGLGYQHAGIARADRSLTGQVLVSSRAPSVLRGHAGA